MLDPVTLIKRGNKAFIFCMTVILVYIILNYITLYYMTSYKLKLRSNKFRNTEKRVQIF